MDMQAEVCVASAARLPVSEELVNTLTHGAGFLLSIAGAVPLVVAAHQHASLLHVGGCLVYVASLAAVYAASSLLHAARDPIWKDRFRRWDQGVIYLLIAGTYTPFVLSYLAGAAAWYFLAAIWTAALLGMFSKIVLRHGVETVPVATYLLLGWVPAVMVISSVPLPCIRWLLLGGILYTGGTPFLKLDQRYPYFHAVWHLLVLGGSACHYLAVLQNLAHHTA